MKKPRRKRRTERKLTATEYKRQRAEEARQRLLLALSQRSLHQQCGGGIRVIRSQGD